MNRNICLIKADKSSKQQNHSTEPEQPELPPKICFVPSKFIQITPPQKFHSFPRNSPHEVLKNSPQSFQNVRSNDSQREPCLPRRRSVVLHLSFLPEENAFAVSRPLFAFTARAGGCFHVTMFNYLPVRTWRDRSTREKARRLERKAGCVEGLADRSH